MNLKSLIFIPVLAFIASLSANAMDTMMTPLSFVKSIIEKSDASETQIFPFTKRLYTNGNEDFFSISPVPIIYPINIVLTVFSVAGESLGQFNLSSETLDQLGISPNEISDEVARLNREAKNSDWAQSGQSTEEFLCNHHISASLKQVLTLTCK